MRFVIGLIVVLLSSIGAYVAGVSLVVIKNIGHTDVQVEVYAPYNAAGEARIGSNHVAWIPYAPQGSGAMSFSCHDLNTGATSRMRASYIAPGRSRALGVSIDGCSKIVRTMNVW